jgi:hypothetical protein
MADETKFEFGFEEGRTDNPFENFEFGYEDVVEATKNLDSKRLGRDARICLCGHPIARHKPNLRGEVVCKPSAMYCSCKNAKAVLEAEDIRDFLRKTVGAGPLHALSRGLQSALEKDHWVKWVVEVKCDKCGSDLKVSPVPVNVNGIEMRDASTHDALLCRKCRGME